MTRDFGEVLAAIAARHEARYARVEDAAADAATLTSVVRRRRVVRYGTTTVLGAAATAALAFGVVQGWDALHVPPAVSPTQPTTTQSPSPTPSETSSPTPSENSTGGTALPVLAGWQDAGADPAVFDQVTITDAVTFGGNVVVAGCHHQGGTDGAGTSFPVWLGDGAADWRRVTWDAGMDLDNCVTDLVVTPFGLYAHGTHLFASADGSTWTQVVVDPNQPNPGNGSIGAVFAVGRRVTVLVKQVSVAESTVASLYTTTDGVAWTKAPVTLSRIFDNSGVADVIPTTSGLVAVGASPGGEFVPTAAVWFSSDGLTWQRRTPAGTGFAEAYMTAVAATSDGLVAVGASPFATGLMAVWSSTDGTVWQRQASPPEKLDPTVAQLSASAVASHGDTLFAAGTDYDASRPELEQTRAAMWRSVGGAHWERIPPDALPGAVPFHVTQLNGTSVGFWPPTGWPVDGPVRVLVATR